HKTKRTINIAGFNLIKGDINSSFSFVVIDSRKVKEECLFIAIKGESFDGHNFLSDVERAGAIGVIISEDNLDKSENFNGVVISYSNTVLALGKIAELWRSKLKAKVIAITGSNGKTTTKEFLSVILEQKYKVNKTEYNNNNHIGVPLTILSTDNSVDVLVLELGTNHFGEIEYTSKIAMPNYALITLIGDSHLEYLLDRQGVLKEKFALYEETVKNNGRIFVNSDDELLFNKCKEIENKITFGFNNYADFKGEIIGTDDYGKTKLNIKYNNNDLNLTLPVYGITSAKNVLAAVSMAIELGLNKDELINGINKLGLIKGRLNIYELNDVLIIDDTYNANPESMKAALELVNSINVKKNKIVVLGDMYELGNYTEQKHIELAEQIYKTNINKIFLVGKATEFTSKHLSKLGVKHFYNNNREQIVEQLKVTNINDSLILFKGSRGMKIEQFIPIITERVS
ncbi:MAG TPA: UDP-N-acetylmuramoyl-tripeptide--D-alanyl-D-alanine ligase, partial [Melioribacteraceae bacterium]|nr:UDP-N-acetylmuramoyl-tripeptide--D-alanyl-D-alanine ligase [Melioribacteraceae bacterium]